MKFGEIAEIVTLISEIAKIVMDRTDTTEISTNPLSIVLFHHSTSVYVSIHQVFLYHVSNCPECTIR